MASKRAMLRCPGRLRRAHTGGADVSPRVLPPKKCRRKDISTAKRRSGRSFARAAAMIGTPTQSRLAKRQVGRWERQARTYYRATHRWRPPSTGITAPVTTGVCIRATAKRPNSMGSTIRPIIVLSLSARRSSSRSSAVISAQISESIKPGRMTLHRLAPMRQPQPSP